MGVINPLITGGHHPVCSWIKSISYMIFFYDIPILMGSLHFEIRLEADAVDKELLFAKTGSVFPASLHGFLGSTYVGKMWSVILHGFWAFWAIGLIGVSCSLSLKLHGHLLSVFFFSGTPLSVPWDLVGIFPLTDASWRWIHWPMNWMPAQNFKDLGWEKHTEDVLLVGCA